MRWVVALVLTGCSYQPSRVGSTPDDGTTADDAPGDTSTVTPDTPVVSLPPTACVQAWLDNSVAFTNPGFISGSNMTTFQDERDPFLSADGLELYFRRLETATNQQIVVVSRNMTGQPFNNPVVKLSLSDAAVDDSKVTMTSDGLTAFVSTLHAPGEGGFDLWQTTRATTGADTAFDAMTQTHLAALNDATDQVDPHISPDGLRMYLAIGNPQQIVVSSRASKTQDFPTATPIPNIGSVDGDADPALTGDERVIVFTSNRPGGVGSTDLWFATRAERDQPFGMPRNVTINSVDSDGDPHISPDGCTLIFASRRAAQGADFDLFTTTITPVPL